MRHAKFGGRVRFLSPFAQLFVTHGQAAACLTGEVDLAVLVEGDQHWLSPGQLL
jgi:hypothetical protein